jgi:hypothetical protein
MEIAYSINYTKKFYQELNHIRKGLISQTLFIRDKEGNIVSKKEKILQRCLEYYEKHFELQDGTDGDSGEEWTMCIQTAEPYFEPPNDVGIEMAISKLKH